jgi:hypothetical protein
VCICCREQVTGINRAVCFPFAAYTVHKVENGDIERSDCSIVEMGNRLEIHSVLEQEYWPPGTWLIATFLRDEGQSENLLVYLASRLLLSTAIKRKIITYIIIRERTIPSERLPLAAEVSINFWGYRMPRGQLDGSLRPYSRFSKAAATISSK